MSEVALNITPATHPQDAAIVAALRDCLPGIQSIYRYGSRWTLAEFSSAAAFKIRVRQATP